MLDSVFGHAGGAPGGNGSEMRTIGFSVATYRRPGCCATTTFSGGDDDYISQLNNCESITYRPRLYKNVLL